MSNDEILPMSKYVGSTLIASRAYMYYAIECTQPTIHDWCSTLLGNMKSQLTRCKTDELNFLGYGPLLVSFFMERDLTMNPCVIIPMYDPWDPHMSVWGI